MAACPDENTLADFISGGLPPDKLASVEEHLDRCRICSDVLVGVARAIPPGSGAVLAELPLRAGDKLGRYRIVDFLGKGGMGVVYRAHDELLDREVALKVIPRGHDVSRGVGEARALARLAHPNVVAVHDVGEVDGRSFIAMELVRGQTLADWMTTPHDWSEVTRVFLQAARGLAQAHAADVLHRDFKPENVLIDTAGRVAVTDFGLARLGSGEHDMARMMGTPAYMAPEQKAGQPATAASDQYAFCLSFHEGLFGSRPGGPLAPRASSVPAWLHPIVLRGLSEQPALRHPSMQSLIADVEAGLSRRASVHLRVNAWFQILLWLIHVLVTVFVIWAVMQPDATPPERTDAAAQMSFVIAALVLALVAFGWGPIGIFWTPINAWGLFTGRRWSITSTLVYSFLSLPTCIGTPFAIYALVSLWKERRR
jgi:hypothetical protein